MKRNRLLAFATAIACITLLTLSAFAAETRASDQIRSYSMNVYTDPGVIESEFFITGTGTMDKIGCESIYVWEKVGTRWVLVDEVLEDDDGMSRTNIHAHGEMIYSNGEAGVEYKVVVTLFAEDSRGRDTRTKVFFVTGR